MYDVWYAVGLLLMRPAMIDKINHAGPDFQFIQRWITEAAPGKPPILRPIPIRAGLIEKVSTTNVRLAIAKFAHEFSPSAPPIGIYCAGRIEQYLAIPWFNSKEPATSKFSDIVALANKAYREALDGKPESKLTTFPALLGLTLTDGALVTAITQKTEDLDQIASEFGLTVGAGRDWEILTRFVASDEFKKASFLLMMGDGDPWQDVTGEQIFFWEGLSERAIP